MGTQYEQTVVKVWLEDPEICPKCGQTMKVIAVISSPAQDDVIERILRHTGEWDPPWKRQPRARGPAHEPQMFSTVVDEEFSQIPPEGEENLNQDLLGGEELL